MAVFLYAIEGKCGEKVSEKSIHEQMKDSRKELQSIVNNMSEEQLRSLVMGLAENDDALRNRIMTQYSQTIDEKQLISLKMEIDRIAYENSDRGRFVDWRAMYYRRSAMMDELKRAGF